jgi:hypothetical protein
MELQMLGRKIDADDGSFWVTISQGLLMVSIFSAKFKNFDFSALLQGVGKVDGYLSEQGVWAFYVGGQQRMAKDYWTSENPDASYPRLNLSTGQTRTTSSYWVKSAPI